MSGMENEISDELRELRAVEIRRSVKTRLLGAIYPVVGKYKNNSALVFISNAVLAMACKVFTPPIVLAGGLFWTTFSGSLTIVGAFSTLAIVTVITQPLNTIMEAGPVVLSALNSCNRIQTFLLVEEVVVNQLEQSVSTQDLGTTHEKQDIIHQSAELASTVTNPDIQSSKFVARFIRATISVHGNPDNPILRDIALDIKKGEFIIISGPTGCGKSTFLKSLLNETELLRGRLEIQPGYKAYCGQTAWIKNTSIRRNIAPYGEIDETLYDSSLDACLLGPDIERLPHNDLFMAGSNGLNLSGGQKQRVVS